MDDNNLLAVLDALGFKINDLKIYADNVKTVNTALNKQRDELSRIIAGLEAEIREKTAVIEQLERELIACRKNGCGNA